MQDVFTDVAGRVTRLAQEGWRSIDLTKPMTIEALVSSRVRGSSLFTISPVVPLFPTNIRKSEAINIIFASFHPFRLVDMSGEDKIQPWKSTWPPPQGPRETGVSDQEGGNGQEDRDTQEVLDYGLLKGVTIVLDGASHGDLSHEASCGGKCKLCVAQAEEATRATAMNPPAPTSCQRSNNLTADT